MANAPIFVDKYETQQTVITSTEGTNFTKIFNGHTDGVRIHAIVVTQTDGSARDCILAVGDDSAGTTQTGLGARSIPANAGQNNGVAPVSLLDQIEWPWLDDSPGRFITLGADQTLWLKLATALSSNQVDVTVFFGEY